MSKVIKLYNPNDKPFGHLSNNWLNPVRIDGNAWPTVTNYILSNMLVTPLYRSILRTARTTGRKKKTVIDDKVNQLITNTEVNQGRTLDPSERARIYQRVLVEVQIQRMNIYELYNMYLGMEYANTVRSAVEKAYNVKFTKDDLVQTLLNTGNVPIEYASNNNLLGIGPDGQGANIIGKTLMQIRFNLRRQQFEQDKATEETTRQERIFSVYLASKILRKNLNEGDDIKDYLAKPAEEIVEIYRGDNDMNYVYASLNIQPNMKDTVLAMYQRGQFPHFESELQNPGTLSLAIRKEELRNVAENRKTKIKNLVFKMYAKYYARKERPELTEEQLNQAFQELSSQAPSLRDYYNVRDRIYDLFKIGELSETLSDLIDTELKNITIPSDEDIAEAENSVVSKPSSQAEVIEEHQSTSSSGSEEANPLKALFETDEYVRKRNLIKMLQQYTGRTYKHYKNKSIEDLESKLAKYRGKGAAPKAGYEISAKMTNLKITRERMDKLVSALERFKEDGFKEAYTNAGVIVSFKEIARQYSEATKKISDNPKMARVWVVSKKSARVGGQYNIEEQGRVRTRVWVPDPAMEIPKVEKLSSEQMDDYTPETFVKSHGTPIRIMADPSANEARFAQFSPLALDTLEIDHYKYPNVSLYISTRLLENTGVKRHKGEVKRMVTRGMGLNPALQLLQKDGRNFVSADRATEIYHTVNSDTHIELEETYLRIAINKKFQNRELQDLLLATQTKKILWVDPSDMLLGAGTKEHRGENKVGIVLMEKRNDIRHDRISEPPVIIRSHDISKFIEKDSFMRSWVEMRLRDMCRIVYQMKDYLYKEKEIDEEIDDRFASIVLDKVYQPCSYMYSLISKDTVVTVPKSFLRMVRGCPGTEFNPEENYDKKIKELREQIIQLDESPSNPTEDRSMTEIREFDTKQREDWTKFIRQLDMPKLSDEEIQEAIEGLEMEQAEERLSKRGKAVLKRQKMERKRLLEQLRQPDVPNGPERIKVMEKFSQQQKEQKDRFLGIDRTRETSQRRAEVTQQKKILTMQISQLSSQKQKEITHYDIQTRDVSKVYWSRIAVMIHFLIQHINNIKKEGTTAYDVKLVIAQVEMLNSQQTTCVHILDNKQDNCIASALLNLLTGIEAFKHEYAEDIPFGKADVKLAASIILNKDLSDTRVEQEEEEEEEKPETVFVSGGDDSGGIDYDDEPNDANFGFNGTGPHPGSNLEIVKGELRAIDSRNSIKDLDELAEFILGVITTIKTFPMSNKIKTNRINFFATVR